MITVILWLLLSVAFFAVGEYFSKSWALNPSWNKALILISMYVLGTVSWLPAIYKGQIISVVGTMWSVMSLLTTLFIGVVIFHETLTPVQIVGVLFAAIAIVLLSL